MKHFIFLACIISAACSTARSEPPPPPKIVEKIVEVPRPIQFTSKCDIKYEGEREILDLLVQFDGTLYATHCNLQTSISVCAVAQLSDMNSVVEKGNIGHSNLSNSSIYFLKSKNNVHKLSRSWSNGDEVLVADMNLKKISYSWTSKGSGSTQTQDFACP